jgi:hypothetical protein
MELTDNQSMIIPVMAACLLARAASSLLSPTPVYKDFAERLVQEFERQQMVHHAIPEPIEHVGRSSAFDEPAAPSDDPLPPEKS